MTTIVDVSAPINWSAFAGDGGVAAIMKCTGGISIKNSSFASMKAGALSAGISVASYHFLYAGNADKQADWYLQNLSPANGERIVCDAEPYQSSSPSIFDIKLFVQTILVERPDLHITIYGPVDYLKSTIGVGADPYLAQTTDLWIAEWTGATAPVIPSATWKTWALWQYTGTQRLYGGSVDLNRFNGSNDNLRAWIGPSIAPPLINLSSVAGLQRALDGIGYQLVIDGAYGPQTGAALSQATDNGALFKPKT